MPTEICRVLVVYVGRAILYVRALTPLHVGVGRGYSAQVDLPVQRDEFGFPVIWSSSLKGALKAWVEGSVRKCFGPEPEELETAEFKQSRVVVTDAKLAFIPARSLRNVYTYVTSPTLLDGLSEYLKAAGYRGISLSEDLIKPLNEKTAVVSKQELLYGGMLVVNEIDLNARVEVELLSKLFLRNTLPPDILNEIEKRGLAVVPDRDGISLEVANRSMLVQYRVRLQREAKVVAHGALWSEEYVPTGTVFASLLMSSDEQKAQTGSSSPGKVSCSIDDIKRAAESLDAIFIGGRETIGRGLVKLYAIVRGGSDDDREPR